MELINKDNINYNVNEDINFPFNILTNSKDETSKIIDPNSLLKTPDSSIHSTNQTCEKTNLKYLQKYKEVYVPKIYLMDYNDLNNINKYEPNNSSSTQNIINLKNNPYFNYGYNLEKWKIYANKIRNKFDELNELVQKRKIRLPEPSNELEYLMELPSDFGGLGELYDERKYENVNFYDPKMPENRNKSFMKQIKFERRETWFPLKPNPESLTRKITYDEYVKSKSKYYVIKKDVNNEKNDIREDLSIPNKEEEKNNCKKMNDKADEKDDKNRKKNYNDDSEEEGKYNQKTKERSRSRNLSRRRNVYKDRREGRDREDRNRNRKYYYVSRNKNRYSYRNNYKYYLSRDNNYYYDKYKNKKNYFKHSFKKYY
jgi:hypothetical protein